MDPAVERPIATVDLAIFALSEAGLSVLLTERAEPPEVGRWSLPGGWVHVDEDDDIDAAARRILATKTRVALPYLEQVATVGSATRDPRGWSLSVSYMALLEPGEAAATAGPGATDARWWEVTGTGVATPLAFDHAGILATAVTRLRDKVEYSTLPAHLLPPLFTLSELQSVYERLLGRPLDKSAFRKRVAEGDFVEPVEGEMRRGSNRPAQLHRLRQPQGVVLFDRSF
jgi:8-oxo-dGTP diphosphatase